MALPGTQAALYAVMRALAEAGDEVLVGDPMYATYEGVIRAAGAEPVPVPLRPERGFRLAAEDVAARVTPRTRVLLLNTPHNPTGAVLTAADVDALGAVARAHDLWILSDEVYEELIFEAPFASPLDRPELAERTVVASSISKAHAAPGFRSGWCVGPAEFATRLLSLAETMLFGNQPFIADATVAALESDGATAAELRARFARRAAHRRGRARRGGGPHGLPARGGHVRAGRRARHRPVGRGVRARAARRGGRGGDARRELRGEPRRLVAAVADGARTRRSPRPPAASATSPARSRQRRIA